MTKEFDFKKEWGKTKKQLLEFSQEAAKVAKKGEEELVKFSQKSMVHIDATAANIHKEKLYYQIGKEYAHEMIDAEKSDKLKNLLAELKKVIAEEKALQNKIKKQAGSGGKKKTVKKKSTRKKKTAKKAEKNA